MKSYTLSLSRWHTVANRLKGHGETLFSRATAVLDGAIVQHQLSDAQKSALTARGQAALADIAEARLALRASAKIRSALAGANAQHGVSAKLAEAEGLRREIQLLEQLAAVDLLTRVDLDQANAELSKGGENNRFAHRGVTVSLVPMDALDTHTRDRLLLERQHQELMDEVNDLNRNTLSLELGDAVAASAGL